MDLFERVSEDIKNAMKAKDKVALETLRNVKKFFLEAKTAPGANDTLTDDAALKIIQKLVKQGKDAAEIYVGQGRQDLADAELAQVKVMEAYLPKQMTPEELEAAINATEFHTPKCPVYQNVDALPHTDPQEIKKNLVAQLTASVRWTQTVKNMVADGATDFTECGPGAVLQGLIKKIDSTVSAHGIA